MVSYYCDEAFSAVGAEFLSVEGDMGFFMGEKH
jgi:hypothetical protein